MATTVPATPTDTSAATGANTPTDTGPRGRGSRLAAPVCVLGSALAVACFFVLGIGARGGSGAEVTAGLDDHAMRYQLASLLAIYAAIPLSVAAIRLGRRMGGDAGRVASAAGVTVAFLMAAYYSTYAAGAVTATLVLDEAGPGVGEATLVLLNLVELARYAPGAALLAAVLVARRRLSKVHTIPAWILLVAAIVPVTSWLAAILVPIWLGVTGALAGRQRP